MRMEVLRGRLEGKALPTETRAENGELMEEVKLDDPIHSGVLIRLCVCLLCGGEEVKGNG